MFYFFPFPDRAEHVGSFLRPKEVLEARKKNQLGQLSDAELRKVSHSYIESTAFFVIKHRL
jgi:methionine synthase II (cobalamin-independent)